MSDRVIELFLFDVLVAILKIEEVSKRFNNADELKHDFMAWDTTIREFEIIGEATNQLINNSILENHNRKVVDFRNILIHHYFGIDEDAVWSVINDYLYDFKKLIITKSKNIDETLRTELVKDLCNENAHLLFVVDILKQI
ncbi:DUF86 domain-containing protein [Sulfurovum riftiae]|uniref:DUF86 domain-containing protein n=1 Tax=Sulfurovum riftiae TaxID=1630136 RepID=A0A151CHH6_9BACT|nr:HepT-like ribonuclease domain-containing protein [Sulfurovum riftiae]KYJ86990.1 hypothetical protein AS592_00330 [Sulfurovum riftiae]